MQLTKKYFDQKFDQMALMIKHGFDGTATKIQMDAVEKRLTKLEKDRSTVQKVKDALAID